MTPPEAPVTKTGNTPPAVSVCLEVLKNRPDFLAAAGAHRQATAGLLVQARNRDDGRAAIRVGFTCSKKVGNAVVRNRAKRRLRALAQDVLPAMGRPGWDYVLIGRAGTTVSRSFDSLKDDFVVALKKLHPGS